MKVEPNQFNKQSQLHDSNKYLATINNQRSPNEVQNQNHITRRVRFSPRIIEYEPRTLDSPLDDMSNLEEGDRLSNKYSSVNDTTEGEEPLTETMETTLPQEPHQDEPDLGISDQKKQTRTLKSCLKKTDYIQAEHVYQSPTPKSKKDKAKNEDKKGREDNPKIGQHDRHRRKPKNDDSKQSTSGIYELNAMLSSTKEPAYTLIAEPKSDSLELGNPIGKLNFVNSRIGIDSENSIETVNLVDSGASHTLVNIDTYFKIPNFDKGQTAEMKTDMRTASDTIKVSLKAKLQFTFVDIYGKTIQFYHTCLIVPNIKYDCYIGNDIMHSEKMHNVNLTHLLFKVNKPNEPLKIAPVKIDHRDPKEVIDVFSCYHVELFPFTTASLTTFVRTSESKPEGAEFIITEGLNTDNGVIETLHILNREGIHPILITNPTCNTLVIPKGTKVASAAFMDNVTHSHLDPIRIQQMLENRLKSSEEKIRIIGEKTRIRTPNISTHYIDCDADEGRTPLERKIRAKLGLVDQCNDQCITQNTLINQLKLGKNYGKFDVKKGFDRDNIIDLKKPFDADNPKLSFQKSSKKKISKIRKSDSENILSSSNNSNLLEYELELEQIREKLKLIPYEKTFSNVDKFKTLRFGTENSKRNNPYTKCDADKKSPKTSIRTQLDIETYEKTLEKIRSNLRLLPSETKYPHGKENEQTTKFGTKNSKRNCPYANSKKSENRPKTSLKTKLNSKHMQLHNIETSFIEPSKFAMRHAEEELLKDPTISKTEIELALKQFRKTGVIPLSPVYMSTCFEKITELKPEGEKLLTDQEVIDKMDIAHLSDENQKLVINTIKKYMGIFSRHEWDIGCTSHVEADIELKQEAYDKCINSKYIPISPQIRDQVDTIIQDMVKYGILRDCSNEATPIISNLLTTRKRDNSIRILLDMRVLNSNCLKLPVVMGNYNELFDKTRGAKFITKFDISNAFFQIPLRFDKQAFTSFFDSNRNRYCFTRCPQGFKNSPSYMEAMMRVILHDIPDAFSYCDDIVLATNGTFREHLAQIEKVLQAILKANLKLKPQKIEIAKENVNILGFIWNNGAISIPKAKCQAIKDFPVPKTQKQIKSFIMTASFYRRLLIDFSTMVYEMQVLTHIDDKKSLKWNEKAQVSFEKTKEAMCNASACYIADHKKPFYCSSDASDVGSSFVLWQYDEQNRTRFIAAHSRTFNRTTKNYSTFKKEILGVTTGLANFDYLLRFAVKIHLFVDVRSILYLRMCKNSSPMLVRFSLTLSNYPIEIQHISTKLNCLADIFSRCLPKEPTSNIEYLAKPMTEMESLRILNELTIPNDTVLSVEQVFALLTSEALPSLCDLAKQKTKKRTENKAKPVIGKNLFPTTKVDRKVHLPRTAAWHPFYKNQKQQLYEEKLENPNRKSSLPFGKQYEKKEEEHYNDDSDSIQEWNQNESNEYFETESDYEEHIDEVDSTQYGNNINCSNVQYYPKIFVGKSLLNLEGDKLRSESLELNIGIVTDGKLTIDSFREAQSLDDDIMSMMRNPKHGYHIKKGVLIKKVQEIDKLVLPDNLLQSMLFSLHYSIYGLHNSRKKMMQIITNMYYVPRLAQKVTDYTANCYFCMTNVMPNTAKHTIARIPKPLAPRLSYSFDILPGLPNCNGYNQIYIFIDNFSLYSILIPAKTKTAKELLKAFKTHIVKPFFAPRSINSDGERATISDEWKEYLDSLDIDSTNTAAHSPWSNSIAELCVKKVKQVLRLFCKQTGTQWPDHIEHINNTLNRTPNTYGYSPQELMFGQTIPHNDDFLNLMDEATSIEDYVKLLEEKQTKIREKSSERRELHNKLARDKINSNRRKRVFEIGQNVMLRDLTIQAVGGGSFKNKFTGPYTIIKLNDDHNTCVLRHMSELADRPKKAHFAHMKPCSGYPFPMGPLIQENEAEDLISKKRTNTYKLREKQHLNPNN
jgi:hypothetical protein